MKKPSLTVGIPAFNEEKTIRNIVRDVLSQKQSDYTLKEVIIVCDGSKDRTPGIVKEIVESHKNVKAIYGNETKGKIYRLNNLYKISKGDVYITLDADMRLKDKYVLNHIVEKFKDKTVGLVGGSSMPQPAVGLFEKVVVSWLDLWKLMKESVNNGVNIHNHLGCISAMSKELYSKVKIPESLGSDEDYLYFFALKNGYAFSYAKKAVAYYRSASNFSDFIAQHSRFLTLKNSVADYFGDWVYEYYRLPRRIKITCLIKELIRNPFFLILSIFLQSILITYIRLMKISHSSNFWSTAYSTKS